MGLCSGAAERVERFVTNRTPHGPDRKSPPSLFSEAAGCPSQSKRNQRYMPGLDGLRAIAVLAVIAFHLGFGWAPGGLLGVGIFFTLSGYLITDLLLGQLVRRGADRARQLLAPARARRLLPALFVMLDRRHRLGHDLRPRPAGPVPQGGRLGGLSTSTTGSRSSARLLLRPLRAAVAAEPPLVARGRGAVLHRLALPAAPRPVASSASRPLGLRHPAAPGADDVGAGARLGDPDGGPLPPGLRPLAGLLRHRHPRRRPALRGGAGDGLAEPPTEPQASRAGARHPRRRSASPA